MKRIPARVATGAGWAAALLFAGPRALGDGADGASPTAPADSVVQEVRVRGTRKETGATRIASEEAHELPGAFGDPFRAIDALPGVVPVLSGLPFFFVRGAPPGNTGYFLDGVRVPLVYHLAVGPSVVHPSLIDRVDFYPGGYPARFGRFTGGIVDAETRADAPRATAEGNVRLFDVGALGETPFAEGKGAVLLAGRYGYPGLLLPLFAPDTRLSYWDYQARAHFRVTPRDTLNAFVFGSSDELDLRDRSTLPDGTPTVGPFYPLVRTTFHRADLRWDHAVAGGTMRTALTLGADDSLQSDSAVNNRRVVAETVQVRTEVDRRISAAARVRAGADALFAHYDYPGLLDVNGVGVAVSCPSRNDVVFGGYADVVWRVARGVEVVPGARFDVFTSRPVGPVDPVKCIRFVVGDRSAAAPAFDPRLSVRARVASRWTWVSAFGITHEPPSFVLPAPGLEIGSLSHGLQSAAQASEGVEAALPEDLTLAATAFLNNYFELTDAVATCTANGAASTQLGCLDERTRGRSFGVELLLRRSFSNRIGGWISYTLSRSTVQAAHPVAGEAQVPSSFDRPHVLNAAIAVDLGRQWRAGGRFTYYSGLPYTGAGGAILGPPAADARLPDFWRIDLRLEKRWIIANRWTVAAVLEGMNVTLNKEAIALSCGPSATVASPGACTPRYVGPISAPSLGVEATY